jgi:putative endonuclease
MSYWVYIIRCADDSLYCGITTNRERRVDEHNGVGATKGRGAKYTSMRRPVVVVYSAQFENRSEASIEEHRIKSLSREQKIALVLNANH